MPQELQNIDGAIQDYKSLNPDDQVKALPVLQQYVQKQYDSLKQQGALQNGQGQQVGHLLRSGSIVGVPLVNDPTQGGTVNPNPISQQPTVSTPAPPPAPPSLTDDINKFGQPISRSMVNGITAVQFQHVPTTIFYGGDADKQTGLWGKRLPPTDPRVSAYYSATNKAAQQTTGPSNYKPPVQQAPNINILSPIERAAYLGSNALDKALQPVTNAEGGEDIQNVIPNTLKKVAGGAVGLGSGIVNTGNELSSALGSLRNPQEAGQHLAKAGDQLKQLNPAYGLINQVQSEQPFTISDVAAYALPLALEPGAEGLRAKSLVKSLDNAKTPTEAVQMYNTHYPNDELGLREDLAKKAAPKQNAYSSLPKSTPNIATFARPAEVPEAVSAAPTEPAVAKPSIAPTAQPEYALPSELVNTHEIPKAPTEAAVEPNSVQSEPKAAKPVITPSVPLDIPIEKVNGTPSFVPHNINDVASMLQNHFGFDPEKAQGMAEHIQANAEGYARSVPGKTPEDFYKQMAWAPSEGVPGWVDEAEKAAPETVQAVKAIEPEATTSKFVTSDKGGPVNETVTNFAPESIPNVASTSPETVPTATNIQPEKPPVVTQNAIGDANDAKNQALSKPISEGTGPIAPTEEVKPTTQEVTSIPLWAKTKEEAVGERPKDTTLYKPNSLKRFAGDNPNPEQVQKWSDLNKAYNREHSKYLKDIKLHVDKSNAHIYSIYNAVKNGEIIPPKVIDSYGDWLRDKLNEDYNYSPKTIKPGPTTTKTLEQKQGGEQEPVKGEINFTDHPAGRALITIYKSGDVSTIVHETAHLVRRNLPDADQDALFSHYKDQVENDLKAGKINANDYLEHKNIAAKNGFSRPMDEMFARDVERYHHDGQAPTAKLQPIFDKIASWLKDIYHSIKGSSIERDIDPKVKDILDRWYGKDETESKGTNTPKPKSENLSTKAVGTGETKYTDNGPRYIGSLNKDRMELSPEVEENVRAAAKRLGLDRKPVASDEEAKQLARSLNISYKDLEGWTPGEIPRRPSGVMPKTWVKAWARAVEDLHMAGENEYTDLSNDFKDAQDSYLDHPNDKSKEVARDKAAAAMSAFRPTLDNLHTQNDTLRAQSGASLQGYNKTPEPFKGQGYIQSLQKVPSLSEVLGEKYTEGAKAPRTANDNQGPIRPNVPRPRLNREPIIDEGKRQAAIEAYRAQKQNNAPVKLSQESENPNILHQSQEPNDPIDDLGLYHFERGATSIPKLKEAIEKDLGESVPIEKVKNAWYQARDAVIKNVEVKQVKALDPIFKDNLRELGRAGAAKFLRDISPETRDKILTAKSKSEFTDEEKKEIAKHWQENVPERLKPASTRSVNSVKEIINDFAKNERQVNNTPKAKSFEDIVSRRVMGGRDTAIKVRAELEKDEIGKSAVSHLMNGESLSLAEGRKIARAIDSVRKVKQTAADPEAITSKLTNLIHDARMGRLGYENPLEAATNQLMNDAKLPLKKFADDEESPEKDKVQEKVNKKITQINEDLSKIDDPYDGEAIGRVLMKHSGFTDQLRQYIQGNVLSSPDTDVKTFVSHPATVAMNEMERWFFGDKSEVGKGIKSGIRGVQERGIPEAKQIMKEGQTAAALSGKSWYKPAGERIPVEPKLAPHRALGRIRASYYQILQTYNTERGLHFVANEAAKAKGLTGTEADDFINDVQLHPERYRDLVKKAIRFGQEETLTQPNAIAQAIDQAANKNPIMHGARSVILPVLNLPLNALKSTLDYQTGLLTSRLQAREFAKTGASADAVKAYQQKVFNRGKVGAAVAGIGGLMTALGALTPPDPKHGRYVGKINAFGNMYDVPAGPMGAMLDTGANIAQDVKNKDFTNIGSQIISPYIEENPLLRASGTIAGLSQALSGNKKDIHGANQTVGGIATEFMPLSGATTFAGNVEDRVAGGGVRKKGGGQLGAIDYPINALPYARTHLLPLTRDSFTGQPYPQQVLHSEPALLPGQLEAEQDENKRASDKYWQNLENSKERLGTSFLNAYRNHIQNR